MPFEILDFPGTGDLADLVPTPTAEAAPFWDALVSGRLDLQRCRVCANFRYPIAPVCPYCLAEATEWQTTSGRGVVVSWIRYHKCYLPQFEPLIPYSVVTVELDAGPRIFGRWRDPETPHIGGRVEAVGERWSDSGVSQAFRASVKR
jgi:uncharacterized OB-fold protein